MNQQEFLEEIKKLQREYFERHLKQQHEYYSGFSDAMEEVSRDLDCLIKKYEESVSEVASVATENVIVG